MANVRNSARRPLPANNFLEALQGLSKDVLSEAKVQATQAITADIPQSFGLEGGDLTANQSYSIEDLKNAEKLVKIGPRPNLTTAFNKNVCCFYVPKSKANSKLRPFSKKFKCWPNPPANWPTRSKWPLSRPRLTPASTTGISLNISNPSSKLCAKSPRVQKLAGHSKFPGRQTQLLLGPGQILRY